MSNRITQLEWPVASGGYRWMRTTALMEHPVGGFPHPSWMSPYSETLNGQGWFITSGRAADSTDPKRRSYSLFDDRPTLFQEFLRTDQTRAGIQAFANRYGLLGAPREFLINAAKTAPDQICRAELLGDWKAEIKSMAEIANLWERFQTGAFNKDATPGPMFDDPPSDDSSFSKASYQMVRAEQERFFDPPGSYPGSGAIAGIQYHVNIRMDGLAPRLYWSKDSARYEWNVVPKSLLAGLWFQFAQSMSRRANYSRCENCPKWIETSGTYGGARSRKRFCSDLCRVQAHRKRGALSANASHGRPKTKRRSR